MNNPQTNKNSLTKYLALGIATGFTIGIILDTTYGLNGLGMALGTSFGTALGILVSRLKTIQP